MDLKRNPIPRQPCPTCGYMVDSATFIEMRDVAPKVGDLSICLNCGEIMMYGLGFMFVPVPDEVLLNFDASKRAQMFKAQNAIRKRGRIHGKGDGGKPPSSA